MQHLGFSYHFLALTEKSLGLQNFKKDFIIRLLSLQMEQPKKDMGSSNSHRWKKTIGEIFPESLNIEKLHAE